MPAQVPKKKSFRWIGEEEVSAKDSLYLGDVVHDALRQALVVGQDFAFVDVEGFFFVAGH